ncbi:MAG TPA: hypothetical protein DCQ56_08035 [Porphyromonadaceae bacterium]|nr:hypothetical protein [Porphyromonadaceae bacterium]
MARTDVANYTDTVQLCQDGKYRWVFEMSLYKNPTILFLLLKIFAWIGFGIWLFTILLQGCDAVDSKDFWAMAWADTKVFLIVIAGLLLLCAMGYYLYALIMGGKYCVLFEMDDKGIMHKQMPEQVKKAQLIGAITALAGVKGGSFTATAAGMNAAVRTEMYTEFASVKSVKAFPHRNLIKVNETLKHNQVYVAAQYFDFVLRYILEHVQPQTREKFSSK